MKTNHYIATLAIAITVTACNSNNDNTEESSLATAVNFTTVVNGATDAQVSRAADAAWEAADQIGIFMVDHGNTTIAESAENRPFTTTAGDGNFAPASAEHTIYYPMNDNAVDFIAYYPYADGITLDNAITIDATNPAFDLLYATADNSGSGYNKTFGKAGGKVDFSFYHKMSKLIMNVAKNDNVGDINEMEVTIKNMKTQASFNLATGEFGAIATVAGDFAPQTVTELTAYSAFVLPAEYESADNLQVVFTINKETKSEDFVWTVGEVEFVSGKYHEYNVTLNRTGMTATGSIVAWEEGNGGSVGVN